MPKYTLKRRSQPQPQQEAPAAPQPSPAQPEEAKPEEGQKYVWVRRPLTPEDEQPALEIRDGDQSFYLSKFDLQALKTLIYYYERTVDYVILRNRPIRLVLVNLLSGVAKGFGIALGITVVAFIAFKILSGLEVLNLPIIGDFIAELLEYINNVQNVV